MADIPDVITVTDDGVDLPVAEVMTGRGFVTGKSGSGKSNTTSVVAEELLEHGLPLMIIDTDGEYYGLQEEYQVLHAAVDDSGDIQVGQADADRLAGLALDGNVPIVLDISGYMDLDDGRDLVEQVLRKIFTLEDDRRKPFLVIVEEIHEYLPERGGKGDLAELLIQIAKRGRKRGLGLCGISQRPAAVSKDFITQCDWLVWHRLTWENDIRVVKKLLGADAADKIQELDNGEAFLMTDWEETTKRIQFRRKRTLDAGATPDLADVAGGPDADLDEEVLDALDVDEDDLETAEEQSDPQVEQLRAMQDRIEELETELERERQRAVEIPAELSTADPPADGNYLTHGLSELASMATHAVRVTTRRLSQMVQSLLSQVSSREREH